MSSGIPITPRAQTGVAWFMIVLGVILLVVAGFVFNESEDAALILTGLGVLVFIVPGVIIRSRELRGERFLIIHPDGFVLLPQDRYVPDESVVGLEGSWEPVYHRGKLTAHRLTTSIYLQAGHHEEELKIRYRFDVGEVDEMTPLLVRLIDHRRRVEQERLAEGKEWRGDGWAITGQGLRLLSRHGDEFIPAEEIVMADVFSENVCVWQSGVLDPVLKVPEKDRDSLVLLQVVRRVLMNGESRWEHTTPSELGLLCVERNLTLSTAQLIGLFVASIVGIVAGPIVAYFAFMAGVIKVGVIGIGAVVLGILGIRAGWNRRKLELHVHMYGLRIIKPDGNRAMRFDEIDTMKWSHGVKAKPNNMQPAGEWHLTLTALEGTSRDDMNMWATFPGDDADLLWLRDAMSRAIANRMWKKFIQDGEVAWTENLWIRPTGIVVQEGGWRNRDAEGWREIPFAEFGEETITPPSYSLKNEGKTVKIDTTEANFWPGLLVMRYLWSVSLQPVNDLQLSERPFDNSTNVRSATIAPKFGR